MFTGIVEGRGLITSCAETDLGRRIVLSPHGVASDARFTLGQSVAVNGVCLTVAALGDDGSLSFDLAGETLRVTNLGGLVAGHEVNLERAAVWGDRIDGHMVQGHVDGRGTIVRWEPDGEDWWLEVKADASLLSQILPRGSVTVDGVSLTAARVESDRFGCTIVPHTREVTNLAQREVGDVVNLEADMIGKWVRRHLELSGSLGPQAPADDVHPPRPD